MDRPCLSYRNVVALVGGDKAAEVIVELAIEYARYTEDDVSAFDTAVLVRYFDEQCT